MELIFDGTIPKVQNIFPTQLLDELQALLHIHYYMHNSQIQMHHEKLNIDL